MTKKEDIKSLEDEFYHVKKKKEKKPSKLAQFFLPKPKATSNIPKIKSPKKPLKLDLLSRTPASFNLGLTYIMMVGLVAVMIIGANGLVWLLGVPTIYCFYRHIKLEQKSSEA